VFQREGKAIAAQWSAASGAWVEIGEVNVTILLYDNSTYYIIVCIRSLFECSNSTACLGL
jgi:hypothetical protein